MNEAKVKQNWTWKNHKVGIESIRVSDELLKKARNCPELYDFIYLSAVIVAKESIRAYIEVPVPDGLGVASVFAQKCEKGKVRVLDRCPPFDYNGGLWTYQDKTAPFRLSGPIERLYRKSLDFQAWLMASFRGFQGRKSEGSQWCELEVPDQFKHTIGGAIKIYPVGDWWEVA